MGTFTIKAASQHHINIAFNVTNHLPSVSSSRRTTTGLSISSFFPITSAGGGGDGEEDFSQGVRAGQNIASELLRTLTPASYEASCSISRSLQNLRGEHPLEGQCWWSLSNSTSARSSLKRRHIDP